MNRLTTYRPESLLRVLQRDFDELNNLFEGAGGKATTLSEWAPRVDIKEEAKAFCVLADLPGIDPKNISISVDNNMLTIQGERHFEKKEEKGEKGTYARIERSYGSFCRQFSLPGVVDANAVSAKYKHGVLEITLPKQAGSVGKSVSIKVEN